MKTWKRVGLYCVLAFVWMMAVPGGYGKGPFPTKAYFLASVGGSFLGSFLLVAIVGEVVVRLKNRKKRSNEPGLE